MIQQTLFMSAELEAAPKAADTFASLVAEAEGWVQAQRDRKAILCYEKALEYQPQSHESDIESRIRVYFALASLWCQQGKYSVAMKMFETALSEAKAFHQDASHEQIGICYYKCAQLFETIWRLDSAINYYESALAQFVAVWPADHPLIMKVMADRENARRKSEKKFL
jgi:tetratricopeptide (TPR) repeat protein